MLPKNLVGVEAAHFNEVLYSLNLKGACVL